MDARPQPGSIGPEADVEVGSLRAKLEVDGEARPQELQYVDAALALYARERVIRSGRALRLDQACRNAAFCWDPLPDGARPPCQEAGVSVPFVGRDFESHRICTIGINHHNFGGLGANWWVCRGHIYSRLSNGSRSHFAYGSGSYLSAIRAALTGATPSPVPPQPEECVAGWHASAFVEAVKCSPVPDVSRPSDAMWRNCPPLYLKAELALLQPAVVLVLGRTAAVERVGSVLGAQQIEEAPSFERLRGSIAGRPVDVFCCNHPSRPAWRDSYAPLVASLLRAEPIS